MERNLLLYMKTQAFEREREKERDRKREILVNNLGSKHTLLELRNKIIFVSTKS